MSDAELRSLAAQIVTSYTRANPTTAEALPRVISATYRGLASCTSRPPAPPPPPAATRKKTQKRAPARGRR